MLGKIYTNTIKKYSVDELIDDTYVDRYRVVKCLGYCRHLKCYKYEVERVQCHTSKI
jgi:hypothetical protein